MFASTAANILNCKMSGYLVVDVDLEIDRQVMQYF